MNSRYSSAISQTGGLKPLNKAGLCRLPSAIKWKSTLLTGVVLISTMFSKLGAEVVPAIITPSTPVSRKHLSTSSRYWMLPLANTGIETFVLKLHKPWKWLIVKFQERKKKIWYCCLTTHFTALMWSQLATPVWGPFCSRVLPCTVTSCEISHFRSSEKEAKVFKSHSKYGCWRLLYTWHPADSNIWAYLTVFSISSKTRILHVMGISTLLWTKLTFEEKDNELVDIS